MRLLPVSGFSAVLRLSLARAWRAFETAAQDPEQAQRALWAEIAAECRGSPMWKPRWAGAAAPRLDQFPITEYQDYQPAIDAAFERGHSPTTATPVRYWASSSGTTSAKLKLFPYLAMNARRSHLVAGAYEASLYRLSEVEPHISLAPMLSLANVAHRDPSPAGVPVGSATSYYLRFMSARARRLLQVIPWEVYTRSELWNDWAPLYAAARNVSLARALSAGWIAAFYEFLLQRIDGYWAYLEGRKEPPPPLPRLNVSARRRRHLRQVFRGGRTPAMTEVWPTLTAVLCWTSASSAAQVPKLEPYLGAASLLDTPYACTEGVLTVPLHDGRDGHPLHPGANVVELLPEDAAPDAANLLPAWRAEPGQRYEVFLTTLSGLIRYRLHDIVQCTGYYRRAPRLAFCCKTAFLLKVTSATFPENELVKVLLELGYRAQDDLLVGPSPAGSAFAIYYRADAARSVTAAALDRALRAASRLYDHERTRGVLGPVESVTVPASHAMWEWRSRPRAKSRYILQEAPRDLPPGA